MGETEPMKKLLTVVVILLVVVAGVVLGVMQPWKQGEDNQNLKTEPKNGELASAERSDNEGAKPKPMASNNLPDDHDAKPKLKKIATRISSRSNSPTSPPTSPPTNNSEGSHDNGGKEVTEHPNSEALLGSWMTSHDGFEFTIILKKGGKGEMRIAEGDRKATPHMITWKADSEKLTLVNKDFKTHDEDVTEGVYKLSNENGIKSLQLEYELEKQEFTFFSVKD